VPLYYTHSPQTSLCCVEVDRVRVSWRRGRTRIGRRAKHRRVSVDRGGVLVIRRSRRRDAGRYICHVAATRQGSKLRSTANTTVSFHRLHDAFQLARDMWINMEDRDVEQLREGSAVMALSPLGYQRSIRGLPESYSVKYIQQRLVRYDTIRYDSRV